MEIVLGLILGIISAILPSFTLVLMLIGLKTGATSLIVAVGIQEVAGFLGRNGHQEEGVLEARSIFLVIRMITMLAVVGACIFGMDTDYFRLVKQDLKAPILVISILVEIYLMYVMVASADKKIRVVVVIMAGAIMASLLSAKMGSLGLPTLFICFGLVGQSNKKEKGSSDQWDPLYAAFSTIVGCVLIGVPDSLLRGIEPRNDCLKMKEESLSLGISSPLGILLYSAGFGARDALSSTLQSIDPGMGTIQAITLFAGACIVGHLLEKIVTIAHIKVAELGLERVQKYAPLALLFMVSQEFVLTLIVLIVCFLLGKTKVRLECLILTLPLLGLLGLM